MPSHPKRKLQKVSNSIKRPSGPLKRSGDQVKSWNSTIGPSLFVIQGIRLPLVKIVLQKYRGLRIDRQLDKIQTFASEIADEVISIWDRARVPNICLKNVIIKAVSVVEWWNSCHIRQLTCPEDVNTLFGTTPKLRGKVSEEGQLDHLKSLMRQGQGM